jgi:hypothetical protein
MIKYGKLGLFALLLNLMHLSSNASIMGSDMGWTCLGGDSFLIKVTVYNDCNGAAMSNLTVGFKCQSTGTAITSLNLTAPTPVDITPFCNTSCSRCQSSTCTFPYGISSYSYQGVVKLNAAGSCCNILMSMTYSTRSSSITTGAAGAGFYNEAMMNRCQNPCDNSPVFTNVPVQILCNGQEFSYNQGAKDSDKGVSGNLSDSISYEWAQPLSAANTNIAYTGSYTYNRPIYFWGFPNDALVFPHGLLLDAQTGDIRFRPMKTEVTVMVVKMNEFRNGIKIAEIRRDIQIIVIPCTSYSPPIITTQNNVRSMVGCVGQPVTFNFSTIDPSATDTVKITYNNAIPGATWTNTNGLSMNPTGTLTWTPTAAQAGNLPYNFTVTATDNACPTKGSFTQSYQITVNPIPKASITISDSGCGNYYFKATPIIGKSPSYIWSSNVFTFSPNTGSPVSHTFLKGSYIFKLDMTAQGCSSSLTDTAIINPYMSVYLPADTTVCMNSTLLLKATVKDVTGPYSLKWGSGTTIFSGATSLTKQVNITKDTTIWIRSTYGIFSCPFDEIRIKVHPEYKISLTADTFLCNLNHMITPVFLTNKNTFKSFRWYKGVSPMVVDSDATLNVYDTGLFSCVATDTFGCTASASIRIHLNPTVIASAPDTSICLGAFSNIMADSVSGHSYKYRWQLNTTLVSSSRYLVVSPTDTTKYTLIATEYLNGRFCTSTHDVTVNVKPLPVIAFLKFDIACEYGSPVKLDDYVTVNGIKVTKGFWSCTNIPALVKSNYFLTENAAADVVPGYNLKFSYTDSISTCYNSDTINLKVYPKAAKPGITVSGDVSFCDGDSVKLSSTSTFYSYLWSTGSKSKSIYVRNTGSYKLVVSTPLGCTSDNSNPVDVIAHPIPTTPVISISTTDSFMECNLTNGYYDWFYKSETGTKYIHISDTSRRINPKTYCNHCNYRVIYTDIYGCVSDSSAPYYFINLSINKGTGLNGFILYPNPAHGLLYIENSGLEPADLMLTDIYGSRLTLQKVFPGKNNLNISSLKPGIYIIRLNDSITYRLVVE